MTITARQTSTRIHAIRALVAKLDALPLAVGEIHRAIDLGTINERGDDRQKAEDAGVRSKGGHTDPTGEAACAHVANVDRHLSDVESNLANLAVAAGNLADVVSRWVRSAAALEEHPRCTGGGTVDEWTRPDCTAYVDYQLRADGTYSYRQDGLCTACRVAKHRWLKTSNDAVA
jgi:hypothetical protein